MLDLASAAPLRALRWWERHHWVEDHPGWTFADYDAASAGDILLHSEYLKIQREVEKKALEKAKLERAPHG